jgi:hypothetical protein
MILQIKINSIPLYILDSIKNSIYNAEKYIL